MCQTLWEALWNQWRRRRKEPCLHGVFIWRREKSGGGSGTQNGDGGHPLQVVGYGICLKQRQEGVMVKWKVPAKPEIPLIYKAVIVFIDLVYFCKLSCPALLKKRQTISSPCPPVLSLPFSSAISSFLSLNNMEKYSLITQDLSWKITEREVWQKSELIKYR